MSPSVVFLFVADVSLDLLARVVVWPRWRLVCVFLPSDFSLGSISHPCTSHPCIILGPHLDPVINHTRSANPDAASVLKYIATTSRHPTLKRVPLPWIPSTASRDTSLPLHWILLSFSTRWKSTHLRHRRSGKDTSHGCHKNTVTMLSVRRPSLLNRALTTPPQTPTSIQPEPMSNKANTGTSLLTLPLSPRQSRSSSDLFALDDMIPPSPDRVSFTGCHTSNTDLKNFQRHPVAERRLETTIVCPFDVDMVQDSRGRTQLFGSGAWSNVYKATPLKTRSQASSIGLLTPPSSPSFSPPVLVAVKQPARPDAKPILENEAAILSYLTSLTTKRTPVVTFYGVIEYSCSLVLGAIPLALEDHLRRCATAARQSLTTSNMSAPVVGSTTTWLSLAHELISALFWLHNVAEVVHGDIKPGNFVLEPRGTLDDDEFPFRPLFIDFSSSHRTDRPTDSIPPGTLSAVTREYTAPELLKSSVLRDPASTATPASDVFSLAITLLVAATGNLAVYDGSVFQRQAMATQGWQAIGFARGGLNGSRVPRQGVVERALERAVLRYDMGRVEAGRWLEILEGMQMGEPVKES